MTLAPRRASAMLAALLGAACATGDGADRGAGPALAGIDVGGEAIVEFATARGAGSHAVERHVATIAIEADLDRAWRLPGRAFAAVRTNGASAGDGPGSSTLEAETSSQVSELWYERDLGDGDLRVRVGVLDANAVFASVPDASGFVHPAPATTPATASLPTWPSTAPGAELAAGPDREFGAAVGIYDLAHLRPLADAAFEPPVDDGLYLAGELTARIGAGRSASDTGAGDVLRIAVGAFRDTGRAMRVDGGEQRGFGGRYALVDGTAWRSASARLRAFAVAGQADADVAALSRHVAAGAVWTGWWTSRPDDGLGLMATRASGEPTPGLGASERAIEAFYRAAFAQAAVSLHVQWLDGTGAEGSAELAVGLRGKFGW